VGHEEDDTRADHPGAEREPEDHRDAFADTDADGVERRDAAQHPHAIPGRAELVEVRGVVLLEQNAERDRQRSLRLHVIGEREPHGVARVDRGPAEDRDRRRERRDVYRVGFRKERMLDDNGGGEGRVRAKAEESVRGCDGKTDG
jgi:hypothetical protein